jgi:hypothetical protein
VSPVARRAHQRRIASLLEQLEEGRAELLRRQAFGATRVALRDLKSELAATRRRLAEATG